MAKPTLLYASPLPPARSGIADYSAWLIQALSEYFDITLYRQNGDVTDASLPDYPVLLHGDESRRAAHFDHRLYQIGNNPWYHGRIYEACLADPGWVVLHELILYFLVVGVYRDRPDFYQRLFHIGGAEAIAQIKPMVRAGTDLLSFRRPEKVPLTAELLQSGNRIIVHSEYTRHLVQQMAPEARVYRSELIQPETVPQPGRTRAEVLAAFGIPQESIVLASFGFVAATKLNDVVCRAVDRLATCSSVPLYYLMVGEGEFVNPYLSERIKLTGYVSESEFNEYLAYADLVINLRYPVMGESSAALLRAFAYEKPCIVTDLGWFAELPDNVVLKLEAADRESIIDYLFEALRLFVQYPEPFLKMGREAGCYVRARHSPTAIAAAYYQLMTGAQPARSNLKPI